MPLKFDKGGFVGRSGDMDVGQIIKRPDGGWFWSMSVIKCNPPPQGSADTKEAAQKAMQARWAEWLKEAGLREA